VDERINRRSVDSKVLLGVREQQITNRPRNSSPTRTTVVPPPPTAVVTAPAAIPPQPPATASKDDGLPPRPIFAPPPPENGGVPPRPKFATPPRENDEIPAPTSTPAKPPAAVSPPRPKRPQSPASSVRSDPPDTPGVADEDKPVMGAASLHRSGSGETSRIRGPRVGGARGPRGPASSGSFSSASPPIHNPTGSIVRASISNIEGLKRNSGKVSPAPPADPRDYAPKKRGGKAAAGAFSRRTMASGSEDEVVDK